MSITKRDLMLLTGAAALLGQSIGAPARGTESTPAVNHDMSNVPPSWMGSEKIAFLAYPKFTALDLVGPYHMLGNLMGAKTFIVAKTKEPVVSDMGLTVVPTMSLAECPADIDIICVPGGSDGTLAAMEDPEIIGFLRDRGARAKYVTSVCTGSLVLAAAGLLKGYKATSHWVARDVLKDFGAEPVDERVVFDRNRVTGAGVTAGLDMSLALVGKLRDQKYAEAVQLLAEYAPAPPFNSGTPHTAAKENVDMMSAMFVDFVAKAKDIAKKTSEN
jgi:cyclohexyl-isocyanide hydratase